MKERTRGGLSSEAERPDNTTAAAAAKPTALRASVVVLGYNGRDYIPGCLESLLDQSMARDEYELIYVDNASADDSLELVRRDFPQVRAVANLNNVGFAEGMNVGFRNSTAPHIVFLNQDTVVHRDWLGELTRVLESAPDIGGCQSNMIMPWYPEFAAEERTQRVDALHVTELNKWGFVSYRARPYTPEPVETLFLTGASVMVKRAALDNADYVFYPPFFMYCEDSDLAMRLAAQGWRNMLVPTSVVYHHHTLEAAFSLKTMRKTLRILKNRFLSFYRNMTTPEFAVFLPILVLGSAFKAQEFHLGIRRTLLYSIALIPLTFVGAAQALIAAPSYTAGRREVLSRRRKGRFWLLKELLKR